MKYHESKFINYIESVKKKKLHVKIEKQQTYEPIVTIENLNNTIIYGCPGIGKYSYTLNMIKNISPTNLKYERKLDVVLPNKKNYIFKISDIHYEIDMELLGCNAKLLFNEVYYKIIDIVQSSSHKFGIIICKNFHYIHNELLDIFYSYMQSLNHKNITLKFILITEHLSFIHDNIIDKCELHQLEKPTISQYKKCFGMKHNYDHISSLTNIKDLVSNNTEMLTNNTQLYDNIIVMMDNHKTIDYQKFREAIYHVLIYNLNVNNLLYYILQHYIDKKLLTLDNFDKVLIQCYKSIKLYNNNYRPIYHLEKLLIYICSVIYEF